MESPSRRVASALAEIAGPAARRWPRSSTRPEFAAAVEAEHKVGELAPVVTRGGRSNTRPGTSLLTAESFRSPNGRSSRSRWPVAARPLSRSGTLAAGPARWQIGAVGIQSMLVAPRRAVVHGRPPRSRSAWRSRPLGGRSWPRGRLGAATEVEHQADDLAPVSSMRPRSSARSARRRSMEVDVETRVGQLGAGCLRAPHLLHEAAMRFCFCSGALPEISYNMGMGTPG